MARRLSPEDKLMKAIFGKTQAEIDAEREKEMKEFEEWYAGLDTLSDEEYLKEVGETREQTRATTAKMMDDVHWLDCVTKYELDNKVIHKEGFSAFEVARIARHFYNAGKRHQVEGLDFDFNGSEVPASEGWEAKRRRAGNALL